MHAPPPYQITLRQFDLWRIVCGALMSVSLVVTAAWAWTSAGTYPGWLLLCAALWLAASVALLLHVLGLVPTSLRWDGQVWHHGPSTSVGHEPHVGHLSVTLDLGDWMLLRFVAQDAWRPVWLPAQRRGHELEWHGLRATVYCARPVSLPTAAPF